MLKIEVIRVGVQGLSGPQGIQGVPGSDANVTTATMVAAFLANAPSNADKQALAVAFGYQLFATRELANADLAPGTPYFNTTSFTYDVTTA